MPNMRAQWRSLSDAERADACACREWQSLRLATTSPVNPKALCPGCDRPRPLDSLRDIRAIPADERRALLRAAKVRGTDAEAICGACVGRLARSGVLPRSELHERIGAPAAIVARYRRIESTRQGTGSSRRA